MYRTCKLCNQHSIWETKTLLCNFSIQCSALSISLIIFFYSPMLKKILNSFQTRWVVNNCRHGLNFIVAKFWPRCADSVSLWTGLWSSGELGRGKSEKACRQIWDRRFTAPAVRQILMQAPIGENTECCQVWLTSACQSARSTRFDHKVTITIFKSYYQRRNYALK